MKLLIVDRTTEGQALCAEKIRALNSIGIDHLDLEVKLCAEETFRDKLPGVDLLVLGPGLAARTVVLARLARTVNSSLHVIIYATGESYSENLFKPAYLAGVRKVLLDTSSPMDLYQELIGIHASNCAEGKTQSGKVVVITSANGGSGVTTIAAALGEVCSSRSKRILLWDLDFETRDLSRALLSFGSESETVGQWVTGEREINKLSLEEAVVSVAPTAFLLAPPPQLAQAMDLFCHTDGIPLIQRIIDTARRHFDVIFVDAGGSSGPAKGALIREAEKAICVTGGDPFGYTSMSHVLPYYHTLMSDLSRLVFLVSRGSMKPDEIRQLVDPTRAHPESLWSLPVIPLDHRASNWQGTNKTLFSMGHRATRKALEGVAAELGLIGQASKIERSIIGVRTPRFLSARPSLSTEAAKVQ